MIGKWILGIAALFFFAGLVYIVQPFPDSGGNYEASEAEGPELNVATSSSIITIPPKPDSGFVSASESHVEAKSERAVVSAVGDVCTGTDSQNFECYEKHYVSLVKEKGIAAAFGDLKARYLKNSYVVAQCHPITHVIGREAALKFKTPGEAYVQGDSFCWSGYYHGVLETFLGKIGRENLSVQINTVCDGIEGKERYSFDYYNCVHGLGHGVMAITEDELFDSLAYCDNLTGDWEQKSCASGAFMENVIVDNLNHFTKYLKPEEPLYPCTAAPGKYKDTCYLMQTSYILKVNNGDFRDTFAWCRKAEEPYRATCFQSLGRDASGRTSSNVAQTKHYCLLGMNFFEQSNCVVGAVKDFISYFHSDKQAEQFCASLDDSDLMTTCRSTATSYYAQF
ncbi:hypothetical protein HYW59_02405 [Candidatus Kaiserbacteria bacterium]|nr:hypothetical protein [Candidatus Kaiserbacteria bacterium]